MKQTFKQTMQEIMNTGKYNLNLPIEQRFCKLATVKKNGGDIHGLLWHERVILEVVSCYNDMAIVKNPNGLEWLMPISKIRFCDVNGISV